MKQPARENKVTLQCVPGHCGIEEIEKVDELAKRASRLTPVGPGPSVGLEKTNIGQRCTDGSEIIEKLSGKTLPDLLRQ